MKQPTCTLIKTARRSFLSYLNKTREKINCHFGCQISRVMSVEEAWFGMRKGALTHLIPDVCGCHVLRILAVAVCRCLMFAGACSSTIFV